CLSASGTERRRYDSIMNLRGRKTHSVSLHYWGWTAGPFLLCLTAIGEVFVLTSLFIERRYRNVAHYPTWQGQNRAMWRYRARSASAQQSRSFSPERQ